MPLSWNEIRDRSLAFSREWANESWNQLLQNGSAAGWVLTNSLTVTSAGAFGWVIARLMSCAGCRKR